MEGQELFFQLLHNYPDGSISIIDKKYQFVFAGGELHSLLQADPRELVGKEMFPRLPGKLRKIIKALLRNVFNGATITDLELPVPILDQHYVMDAFPLRQEDGSIIHVGLIIRSVSALKKVEQELRQSLRKEKELSELKSHFITMASHEFRTPLTAVLSSAQLLRNYAGKENANVDRHIRCITSAVGALNEILDDFLSVQRMEEGRILPAWKKFNLREQIETAILELNAGSKKITRILYVHRGEEMVSLDPSLLKQVLVNLLSNSIKFSPETAPVEATTEVSEGKLILTIKDYGIGIPDEYRDHAFERFQRAANALNIQGTGLGLHIAKSYTTMMKGVIDYTSHRGKGTLFTVQFPLSNEVGSSAADLTT